jgi:DNA topoisomerase-1
MILILVESPNKSRAVAQYARAIFDEKVVVRSTFGHLRDLPKGKLGVNIPQGFLPEYILRNSRAISQLRPLVRDAQKVYLAMDPDREGEAIAWHVTKVFEKELHRKPALRVSFNAITQEAVQAGLGQAREIDKSLMLAAVARRVIDRLIGYKISPRLWAHVDGKDLSAGRVQTAALRILAGKSRETWEVDVEI